MSIIIVIKKQGTYSAKRARITPVNIAHYSRFTNYAKKCNLALTFLTMCATMEVVWKDCGSSLARGPFTTESSQIQCLILYLLIYKKLRLNPCCQKPGLTLLYQEWGLVPPVLV